MWIRDIKGELVNLGQVEAIVVVNRGKFHLDALGASGTSFILGTYLSKSDATEALNRLQRDIALNDSRFSSFCEFPTGRDLTEDECARLRLIFLGPDRPDKDALGRIDIEGRIELGQRLKEVTEILKGADQL